MITAENLEKIIEELLPGNNIPNFSKKWILKNQNTTEDSIRMIYTFLKSKGVNNKKIASQAQLLGGKLEIINANYQKLKVLGVEDKKIATYVQLLGKDPTTIETNYQKLKVLGLTNKKITQCIDLLGYKPKTIESKYQKLKARGLKDENIAVWAYLLGRDQNVIETNYQKLKVLGLSDENIVSHSSLLKRDQNSIQKNYDNLFRLLKQDGLDDYKCNEFILANAQLLGNSKDTIKSNFQFLNDKGIDYYHNAILFNTTTQLKRKKMAWILRELFDYRNLLEEQKKDVIHKVYSLIKDKPKMLKESISSMEKSKDKLMEIAKQYK